MHIFGRGSSILLLIGDFLTFTTALVLTLLVRYQEWPSETVINLHLRPFVLLFIIWILVFLIAGLYDKYVSLVRKSIPALVIRVQFINVLLAALFFFVLPFGIEPKTNLVIYLVISTSFIIVWRLYIYPLITTAKSTKVLVIGDSKEANDIARVFATNPFFKNIQPYQLSRHDYADVAEFRDTLLRFVANNEVEMIIADMRDAYASQLTRDFYILAFEDRNIRFFNLPGIYEHLHHRIPPELIEELWLLENVATSGPHYTYDFLKRTIDIVGAFLLLIPSILVFPWIALAVKLHDGGPIFYRSLRVGQFNLPIYIYKFRTMTGMDQSSTINSILEVTKVGAFLRKTRLDELPQLINILRGDLSFIGPRPETPARAHIYAENIPYYNLRHHIKPGLSGWAQINNFEVPRNEVDIERTIEKLSFDLYYLKHRSLLLDIEVALKTISTLLMRTGT